MHDRSNVHKATRQRLHIVVQGIVQGVGFRPFVYTRAHLLGLSGFVLNNSVGVVIEVEGEDQALADFQRALHAEIPPLAHIITMTCEHVPLRHERGFTIIHSDAGTERRALISPDTATCADCLHEIFDQADRRFHYPFTNCTNCGPRFTIIQDVPYDRDKTTMRVFPMCPICEQEYADPLDRRFHAQPNACPACGPQLSLLSKDEQGQLCPVESSDPLSEAARLLAQGAVLAIKGLGGYHLSCDALHVEAVQRLRQSKRREDKPFALMVPDVETARHLCFVSESEATLLQSHQRPIVLLRQREKSPIAPAVAPDYQTLGIMLPYTPLHHLLLSAFRALRKTDELTALVMTSGNLSDEPIAYEDDDARSRLSPLVAAMLTHNRAIHMRCDDSVLRIASGGEQFFRRSRGYAPEPIILASALPVSLLACGAHLKNTFCLGKDRHAFLSHHIGDLENLETLISFREGIEHFQRLFDITPAAVAYDLHPDYLATQYALGSAIPQKIGVQHHYAHIASVIAEHGLTGPVIGVAGDGTGYGTDGALWGCEVMVADLLNFERVAHLTYVPLPGGEQAIRQPWRMAATYLAHTYRDAFLDLDIPFVRQLDRSKWHVLSQMITKGINCPPTSSLGRLFDAVAALTLGLHTDVSYEGQAAIALETLATTCTDRVTAYPFLLRPGQPMQLDVTPLIDAIVQDLLHTVPAASIAGRFHMTIAEMLAAACDEVRKQTGLNSVALSGGVFQNRLLLELLIARLETLKFQVSINRRVPPNDGGLSLGQLAVAAARLRNDFNPSRVETNPKGA
ncbi:MAG TPA: carbamoyltransferase HypF [Ktedonobacteraceae bacterium]|jgi:hydrogenase maturation protein HypF|nr:carbamoyltransferase HypF [Ktedonobacteraceae bacterium]